MRTAKAQIRLRGRAVWSGHSLSADRIIWHHRMYQWRANARMKLCACARWICISAFWTCSKASFRLTWLSYTNASTFITSRTQFTSLQYLNLVDLWDTIETLSMFLTNLIYLQMSFASLPSWHLPYNKKNSADDKQMIFVLFFVANRIWHFMQIVSLGDNLYEVPNRIF